MLEKRIIPCLDVLDGRVVKGINFVNFKDVGDPALCAAEYERQGADEIVLLDISATYEERRTMVDVLRKTAEKVSVPLAIGGGIRTVDDFREMLDAGADKVSINSAAVENPDLIRDAAGLFASERVVLAIDAKLAEGSNGEDEKEMKWNVYVTGGRTDTGIDLVEWARRGCELGAGEILLTSIDTDGTKAGFDLSMLRAVCAAVNIPVIASGGGGDLTSFVEVFKETPVDAALAASIFHFGDYTVGDLKAGLRDHGIPVL
ncbi:MAG: imidazole glycerol phosphate synthase subunit HisF [Clostridiales bacterium]|nr:imidazole glycerol phosphate synthase subunit HisF [Clostridiales bacterium]